MQQQDNFICEPYYLLINDKVVYKAPLDDLNENIPNGTIGTVVGYTEHYTYHHYSRDFEDRASGKYATRGAPLIKWSNGYTTAANLNYIIFLNKEVEILRFNTPTLKAEYYQQYRVDDLPKLPFNFGNIVKLKHKEDIHLLVSVEYPTRPVFNPHHVVFIAQNFISNERVFVTIDKIDSLVHPGINSGRIDEVRKELCNVCFCE